MHSVRVLATAKVPLMTLALAGGAAVNVTLAPHREAALPARRTAAAIAAQLEARPHARKLLLLVKALLAPRGALADFCGTLGGGVSSFVATLLVLAFCALQVRAAPRCGACVTRMSLQRRRAPAVSLRSRPIAPPATDTASPCAGAASREFCRPRPAPAGLFPVLRRPTPL